MIKTFPKICFICFSTMLVLSINATAQSNTNTTENAPCKAKKEHRQFDFWVGDWDVKVNNQQAGTNDVKLVLGDCVVFENWTGARGMSGKSFNFFNAAKGKWQQVWVDDRGGVLEFTGEFRDGAMRFTSETVDPKGVKTLHKLTFFPLPEKRVRQLWESSKDNGSTWNVVFDGLYIKKKQSE